LNKRRYEELYDLRKDPEQVKNIAGVKAYEATRKKLSKKLDQWMWETNDPSLNGGEEIEKYLYSGMNLNDSKDGWCSDN